MGKTLFISDLDGTLLGKDSRVSSRSVEMINRAIGAGALFSVATARTPSTVSFLLRDIDASLPFIVMTGAAIWNPSSGLYIRKVTMDEDVALRVLDTIRTHRLPAFIYTLSDNIIDIYHMGHLSEMERKFISERADSGFKRFHIPEDGCSTLPERLKDVALFYAMQPSAHVQATVGDVREIAGCNPVFYHDMFGPETGIMEVFSARASKANALRWLKTHTGADKVVAFGDNINDIPMLREADVAVAVENAVDEVKEVADIIIGPNTEDSVARFIMQY